MTLIELVTAVAVLAVVTTELLVLRSRSIDISSAARNTRVAKELARLKMEEYLAYYNNVPAEDTGKTLNIEAPEMEGEFKSHPGFFWVFEEDTQDFDQLLPEEEETTTGETEEEDIEHNMVIVTLKVYRQESSSQDPDVIMALMTVREETADEAELDVP